MNKNIALCAWLMVTPFLIQAQELSQHFMRGTLQASFTNPAIIPDASFVLGLPNFYNDVFITDVTYNDIIQTQEDGGTVLSLDGFLDQLSDENFFRLQPEIRSVSLGFRINKFFFTLSHAARGNSFLNYPKNLAEFITNGNAQFIGQTVEIGPDVQVSTYHETSLGLGYQLNEQISIGGRLKLLNGIFDLSTTRTSLQVTTDSEIYQTILNADYVFNSSGFLEYDGFDNFDVNDDLGDLVLNNLFGSNTSLGVDLGIHFDVEKFDLAISVLDLGELSWETDVFNYAIQGIYEYEGLDITEVLFDNDAETSLRDTLQDIYQAEETQNAYASTLGPKVYISGSYKLSDKWRIGAVGYLEDFRDEFFPALGVNVQGRLGSILDVGVLYAFRNKRFDNIGANLGLNLGPLQIIAATDNLITALNLENANSANIRVGVNLVFGKNTAATSPTDPDKISNQDDFFSKK